MRQNFQFVENNYVTWGNKAQRLNSVPQGTKVRAEVAGECVDLIVFFYEPVHCPQICRNSKYSHRGLARFETALTSNLIMIHNFYYFLPATTLNTRARCAGCVNYWMLAISNCHSPEFLLLGYICAILTTSPTVTMTLTSICRFWTSRNLLGTWKLSTFWWMPHVLARVFSTTNEGRPSDESGNPSAGLF